MYVKGINYGMSNNLMDESVVEIEFSDGLFVSSTRLEDGEIIYVTNSSVYNDLINADEDIDIDCVESYDFDVFDPEDMSESEYYELICITRCAMKELFYSDTDEEEYSKFLLGKDVDKLNVNEPEYEE